MKNKRLCKVWSKRHLPADLWPQILSRLPVKSLLRFRCVSKSWLSLINDAEFARLHLNNFKNNRDETHLFVVQGKQQDCVVRCSDTFKTNSETLLTLGRMYRQGSWHFVCSIDGLVLLKSGIRSDVSGLRDLKVWNPSIRKFHEFPSLLPEFETIPELEIFPDIYWIDAEIGFGYDPLLKDYKHVKLIFVDFRRVLHSVAVYTLGAGSWKIIPFQGKGSSCSNWRWRPNLIDMKAVYFRGSLYFIANDDNNCVLDLVSFDLSSEVFSVISLPEHFYDYQSEYSEYKGFRIALIDGGCTLAVSYFDSCVWVLENCGGEGGISDSDSNMGWTRRYEFDLAIVDILHIKKNSDIVMQYCGQEVSWALVNKHKNVKHRWDLVMSFNLETNQQKILLQNKHHALTIRGVRGYVESLILLK